MPLLKRLIKLGVSSKAIIIPKSWLDFYEHERGPVEVVQIEVNRELRIIPVFEEVEK